MEDDDSGRLRGTPGDSRPDPSEEQEEENHRIAMKRLESDDGVHHLLLLLVLVRALTGLIPCGCRARCIDVYLPRELEYWRHVGRSSRHHVKLHTVSTSQIKPDVKSLSLSSSLEK